MISLSQSFHVEFDNLRNMYDVLRKRGEDMIGGMVKSIALRGCHDLIAELGGSPDRVARAAGIASKAFADPDMNIDGAALASYLELAAMHCGT